MDSFEKFLMYGITEVMLLGIVNNCGLKYFWVTDEQTKEWYRLGYVVDSFADVRQLLGLTDKGYEKACAVWTMKKL